MQDCPYFETCSAPLCPLDNKTLHKAIWYPDEEICNSQKYCNTYWIKRQRKIARKMKNFNNYFTIGMLKSNKVDFYPLQSNLEYYAIGHIVHADSNIQFSVS
jgi:hypothetical protein